MCSTVCDRIWEKGPLFCRTRFFKLSPFQGIKSPRHPTWFIGSLDLYVYFTDSMLEAIQQASFPEQWATKVRHKIPIFKHDCHARSPRPHWMWAGLTICSEDDVIKNIHARFEVLAAMVPEIDKRFKRWKLGIGPFFHLHVYMWPYLTNPAYGIRALFAQCAFLVPQVKNVKVEFLSYSCERTFLLTFTVIYGG